MSAIEKTVRARMIVDELRGAPMVRLVAELPDAAPVAIKEGLARRAAAERDGRCDCGAPLQTPLRPRRRAALKRGQLLRGRIDHTSDCPAATAALEAAMMEHGWSLSIDMTGLRGWSL
ncbi:hypothetical protein FE697_007270 [Mumia zhuanghuii]|uniref:Uncharacterized protein n=2 Tax=Mumia TaxID=1546255 RepID=A0ABW1QPF3_9ACTN|nr:MULTISPECIES: hypothetical protein [Mumia]KAA1423404.1 hypothetical protein FE697_007270 [Mumia zhuanghuii]